MNYDADLLTTLEPALDSCDDAHEQRLCPVLTLLTHVHFHRIGERFALSPGHRSLELSRIAPEFCRPGRAVGKPLNDTFISRSPIKIQVSDSELTIDPTQSSTPIWVDGLPLTSATRLPLATLERGLFINLAHRAALLLAWGSLDVSPEGAMGMVGHAPGIEHVREEIKRLADLEVPVLIRGETGSGKELVAQAIVATSLRRGCPLIALNMASLAPSLAAAELFGTVKGAYTGALGQQPGYFRSAEGGTLFMDEIGEAPNEIQTMLLRVLETGEIFPVGRQTPVRVDVRLLAATDANLEAVVAAGGFKAPLLHRLANAVVQLPPLRARAEDILRLLALFARDDQPAPTEGKAAPWLPVSVAGHLLRYPWPGNVRQLRNVVRQLVIASRGQRQLRLTESLHDLLTQRPPLASEITRPSHAGPRAQRLRRPREVGYAELLEALSESDWCLKNTAERLGITRPSIYRLLDIHAGRRDVANLTMQEIQSCHMACKGDPHAMARRLLVEPLKLKQHLSQGITLRV